jgi:hypothetical protein
MLYQANLYTLFADPGRLHGLYNENIDVFFKTHDVTNRL